MPKFELAIAFIRPSFIDLCSYAFFQYQKQGHLDETAVNGIKLYCSSSTDFHDTGYVTSSVGTHGDWYGELENYAKSCYQDASKAESVMIMPPHISETKLEGLKLN